MAKYVFVKQTCSVGFEGRVIHLKRGEAWDAADSFVKARPDFFADEPIVLHRTDPSRPVEDTTAVPGEKRRTK